MRFLSTAAGREGLGGGLQQKQAVSGDIWHICIFFCSQREGGGGEGAAAEEQVQSFQSPSGLLRSTNYDPQTLHPQDHIQVPEMFFKRRSDVFISGPVRLQVGHTFCPDLLLLLASRASSILQPLRNRIQSRLSVSSSSQ